MSDPPRSAEEGFGSKKITFWGSVCLNLNNCMGAAMVTMPLLFQQAGWFTNVLMMTLIYVLSTLAGTMLCEAMQRIPGNFEFKQRYEFATTVRHYWGGRAYWLFQILYNLSMQASNIASMIISAQVLDEFVRMIFGRNYALQYQQWPPSIIHASSDPDVPWCSGSVAHGQCSGETLTFVISLGYVICMAICIPFGYLNLDENMWFQWFSFWGLLGFTMVFWLQFGVSLSYDDTVCYDPLNVPYGVTASNMTCDEDPSRIIVDYGANGPHRTSFFVAGGQSAVVGIATFAYAYIVTIPSWVNEKRPDVNINAAVWLPASIGLFMKILTGLLGAWAFALMLPGGGQRDNSDNILDLLLTDAMPAASQYAAYLWDITTLIPGIPVLAIMVRYNLLSGRVCGRFAAFFWGVVAPWIVTMFCYESNVLLVFCNWVAIVVQGYINFVVPALLYRAALLHAPDEHAEDLGRGGAKRRLLDINNDDDDIIGDPGNAPDIASLTDVNMRPTQGPVNALPRSIRICGRTFRINRIWFANFMVIFFTVMSTASIVLNIVEVA
eukprot:m.235246 g.235246  ORF g.235246 m.235246 type:complete len:551 (+) comp19959_c0_seq1:41-1693(+)